MYCFHLEATVNSAARNTAVQVSLQDPALNSSDYIPKIEFGKSYGNSSFSFLKKLHTVFCNGCTI